MIIALCYVGTAKAVIPDQIGSMAFFLIDYITWIIRWLEETGWRGFNEIDRWGRR
jgi:hypothetical protein